MKNIVFLPPAKRIKNVLGIRNVAPVKPAIAISVNSSDMPSAEVSQAFCIDANPTTASLEATGTNLLWYNSLDETNELTSTQVLQSGSYFVSQTVDGCESNRFEVSVTVNETNCETVTGILHYSEVNISTYPSPTNGNFQIDLGKKYQSIQLIIRDVEGMIIDNSTYTATDKIQMQIKGAKGIYLVQMMVENNIISTMRILKN